MRRVPAWQRLVSEGFFAARGEAERWILAGKVRAGEIPVTSAGQPVAADAPLAVRGLAQPYIAKGGLKLESALQAFSVAVRGRVCIDAGASTGGFTDCLVKHGASRVYAVDAGFGQLAGSLRQHPSVVNLERTNIGEEALLSLDPRPSLGTVDLSYLSLRKAVPQFARILHGQGDLLCLVKPLFEIDDAEARRTGNIPPGAYEPLLMSLADDFQRDGYRLCGVTHSPVTGNNGTLEFFLWLSMEAAAGLPPGPLKLAVSRSVSAARALPIYQ
ncbi:MAG: TlyA family RNA methyltransferase [Firmicutes bacterium]|nr:TlyA family RNA methyltransferase [Bacillota bacterium]